MIRNILIGIVGLIVIAVGISFVLPQNVKVARSVVVETSPEHVFSLLSTYETFNSWSPWAKRDPNTKYTFEGPSHGVGARMRWESDHPNVGNGMQEITAIVPNERIEVFLDFGDMGQSDAYYLIKDHADGAQLTWGFSTDMGYNPISRYMGLMMDTWIGADYEQGLADFKKFAESTPPPAMQ